MPIYPFFRQILFNFESEKAHKVSLDALRVLSKLGLAPILFGKPIKKPIRCMGLDFPNPVGLAAGLDKNGEYIDALSSLGFGFIEIGTVTPRAQLGQAKPRLFRLQEYQALINRMGFNNKGIDYLLEQVAQSHYRGILGINIGKNVDTSLDNAVEDYLIGFRKAYPWASYITVNISSPNTEGLRALQGEEYLSALVSALKTEQIHLNFVHQKYVPLVIKISPDLTEQELQHLLEIVMQQKIDALIATNTTITRDQIHHPLSQEKGGLSGRPLFDLAKNTVAKVAIQTKNQLPIIAVGGVMNTANAIAMKQAGASLIQLYTGLIYAGPKLVGDVARVW